MAMNITEATANQGELAEAAFRRRMADDFMLFVDELVIPSASGPKRFGDIMEPFQRECFEALAPSLKAVRDGTMPPIRRFWIERTKKAGKDSDLAVCLMWLLAFAKRPLLMPVSAARQDQAGIVKKRIKDLLFYNPWLNNLLRIQINRVIGSSGIAEVKIEATGRSKARHGDTPDVLVLNELVHVDNWEINETHMNNANGVPRGIVLIFTNAGFKGTPAWRWKNEATNNPDRWCVMEWKALAPWLSEEDKEEARRLDPVGTQFKRLWLGQWQSGVGNALDEGEIDRCFQVDGPLTKPEPGWQYIAGLDIGIMHDHTGLVLVGVNQKEQRIRVARVKGWAPDKLNPETGKKEVPTTKVKQACLWLRNFFQPCWFGYDPAEGGRIMAQQLREKGMPMVEVSFSSQKSTSDMADALMYVVKSGRLECYEDEEGRLRRDLGKFSLVPKAKALGGYKLEAVSDEWGHADVGVALVMCLPKALELLGGYNIFTRDTVVAMKPLEDDEATEEELEEMPEELRDIYETAGKPLDRWDDDDDW